MNAPRWTRLARSVRRVLVEKLRRREAPCDAAASRYVQTLVLRRDLIKNNAAAARQLYLITFVPSWPLALQQLELPVPECHRPVTMHHNVYTSFYLGGLCKIAGIRAVAGCVVRARAGCVVRARAGAWASESELRRRGQGRTSAANRPLLNSWGETSIADYSRSTRRDGLQNLPRTTVVDNGGFQLGRVDESAR